MSSSILLDYLLEVGFAESRAKQMAELGTATCTWLVTLTWSDHYDVDTGEHSMREMPLGLFFRAHDADLYRARVQAVLHAAIRAWHEAREQRAAWLKTRKNNREDYRLSEAIMNGAGCLTIGDEFLDWERVQTANVFMRTLPVPGEEVKL